MNRNRFFVLLGIVFIAAALYYYFSTDRSREMVLIGTVDANQVIVNSKIAGRIERLLVDEGTQVKQGDLIAVLDSAELDAQKRAAAATLGSLRSKVSETRATEAMTRGFTSSDVANAEARLQSAKSQLLEAQANLEQVRSDTSRIVWLAEQGIASQQDRDRANAQLKAQQAKVQSLQDQVRAAQADLTSAQARLHNLSAAESTVASTQAQLASTAAQLAEAETRLGYTKIYAPVSGTVSVRAAREGEVVNPGTPIVTIVDLSDTWVFAAIPETYAGRISLGEKLNVRLPGGELLLGQVIFKGAEADFATQRDVSRRKRDIKTVSMKVRIDNSKRALVPGMTAEVLVPRSILEPKNDQQRTVQHAEESR